MDERRVADYFVVAGLPDNPEPVSEISRDSACHFKLGHNQAPITDVAVIFPTLGEAPPDGFTKIDSTPTGFPANLNHGSLRSAEVYLCYRRGRDKPPLVDVGIMYEGKERLMSDSEVVLLTPGSRPANVNNSGSRIYVTYRRAPATMPCNELVVTDMCVILASKGELPPHAYCMINKNLNRGMVGSDVFLCYKKSMNLANLISYKPAVLCRYPRVDRASFPFPSTVPLFCLPMGASIECWPAQATQPRPVFSTFVLTVSDAAEKVYGAAVTFYERISRKQLTEAQYDQLRLTLDDEQTVNINKCICLLSHWPFFETFEKFLCFIFEMSLNGPHLVPIERQISHFLDDVPFPSPQRPHILVQLDPYEYVVLTQPEDFPIPRSGAGFRDLLLNLGPDNCLMVLLLALTEQKLLVHSLRPNVLTAVAEAISMIMFPFKWQCPYIPLCPLGLAEVLHAPLPFLIGVDSRFFDLYDPPQDVCCVDLDTNTISVCEDKRHLNIKLLPKKSARALRSGLEALSHQVRLLSTPPSNSNKEMNIDLDFVHRRKELAMELEIQELFLRFMASILKGYRNFLLPITRAPRVGTTDPSSLFDLQGFLRSRDKSHHKFFQLLMKTQMFIRFIEERSFVSDMDAGLAFFDECTEKVDAEEDGKLLELDDSHRNERTVFITPLEPSDPSAPTEYHYHSFNLDPVLFGPRKEQLTPGIRRSAHPSWLAAAAAMFSPGSPMARRTKHEIRSAQRLAKKHAASPELWAKCLLATCYSLWFLHLPGLAMVDGSSKAITCLRTAYDLLVRIHKMKLQPSDEVCYRVMMQLCGVYGQPVLAVKLLFHMKRCGVQPNALTYGLYNRAVLEAKWPSDCTNSSQLLWNKLRNVILGVALFRQAGSRRRLSEDQGVSGQTMAADAADGQSHTSVDSANSHDQDKLSSLESRSVAFDRFRSRIGSIVRPGGTSLLPITTLLQQKSFESSAGLLMTGSFDILEKDSVSGSSNKITNSCINRRQENQSKQNEPTRALSPVNARRRPRSGSCSEIGFRGHILLDGADTISSRPISPLAAVQDVTNPNSPRSPRTPRTPDQDGLRLLIRSESFANDTKILDKLSRLKHETNSDMDDNDKVKQAKRSIFPNKFHEETEDFAEDPRDWTLLENSDQTKSPLNLDYLLERTNPNQNSQTDNWKENISKSQSNQINNARSMSSPLRTPVTQNDPLGALDSNFLKEMDVKKPLDDTTSRNILPHRGRHSNHALSDTPLLFTRSSTFASHSQDEEEDEMSLSKNRTKTKPIKRSSTMPADVAASGGPSTQNPGVASSFSSLSSSLKSSFSRYSPARFSLRKEDLRIGTQLIENALNNLSPSNITTKKSNEILLGGLNSLKSAATSMAKKFDEIKEAISATGTPVKSGTSGNGSGTYSTSYMATGSLAGSTGAGCLAYAGYGGLPNYYTYHSNEGQPEEDSTEQESVAIHQNQLDHWWEKFAGDSSRKGSSSNLYQNSLNNSQHHLIPENLYPKDRPPSHAIALELILTSCSKCHQCCSVLYDEEIMAGWVPEDSNLNTKCPFCQKATVPFLNVTILDYRSSPSRPPNRTIPVNRSHVQLSTLDTTNNSLSSIPEITDTDTSSLDPPIQVNLEPITVPYLNPLVLRKELENILYSEGDICLTRAKFVDEHPIIYWNMVWVFQRINVISHLPGLTLESNIVNKENRSIDASWSAIGTDHRHVRVRCMWDNPRLHEEVGQPMYLLWQQNDQQSSLVNALVTDRTTISRSVMQMVISSIQCNDLNEPLRRLATERHKFQGVVRNHSIYREILFLAMTALGRDHIDIIEFDKEYNRAYDSLLENEIKSYLHSCDQPLNTAALCCRCYFRDLEL